jgi:hypothetical protein
MVIVDDKINNDEQMHLVHRPFRWPRQCAGAIQKGIAQWGMSRATLEATGCRHWATTCSVLPQWPPGQQANKQPSKNTPRKLAVLMAMAMRRYVTAHIAQRRRFRALLDATKRHHPANIAANSCNWSRICRIFTRFFIVNLYKKVTG